MNINYTLKRSRKRRKTISLQISNNSEVTICAPYFTPAGEINRFVREKQNWIKKTIQKQTLLPAKEKKYTTGELFYYLGETFPLEVFFEEGARKGIVFWSNRFYLNSPNAAVDGKSFFISWYKKKAREYLSKRVEFVSRQLSLQPKVVKVTSAGQRWGSCSEDNNLSFSFRLIMASPAVIDYVVVHELMHIREKSHSSRFWKLIEAAMPEYKIHRHWLKEESPKFIL
ncbi:MAG: SprT family zinc-dependent metalloprotease [Smithellaceae bacterium]|jgi:predicted metal-dependent hydrolase